MTPIKRPLAAAGAAALLALSLSACGGAPTDASVEDYCAAVGDEGSDDFIKAVTDEDWDKVEDLVKEQADEVEEVGTPDDIPDEAREGFEIQLDTIKGLKADDFEEAFNAESDEDPFEKELSKDEKKKVDAYNEYESETCDEGSDSSEDDSSEEDTSGSSDEAEVPSDDVPTDIPSIDPSDIPTDLSPEDLESLQEELEKLTESAAAE
ncbi:MAG TPA: hypothetical protein VNS46_10810 [Nocardioides sp.]|nr:hypothetical protein [Nocardioides sp.]